ncbi:MAG: HEAT repeat domain-containing protein, partial [Elusimicrobiota bacterium]
MSKDNEGTHYTEVNFARRGGYNLNIRYHSRYSTHRLSDGRLEMYSGMDDYMNQRELSTFSKLYMTKSEGEKGANTVKQFTVTMPSGGEYAAAHFGKLMGISYPARFTYAFVPTSSGFYTLIYAAPEDGANRYAGEYERLLQTFVMLADSPREPVPTQAELLDRFKKGDASQRKDALYKLSSLASAASETLPLVLQSLKSNEKTMRIAAVEAIGRMRPAEKEIVPLLARLLNDPESDVRSAAAEALEKYGPAAKYAVPNLIQILGDADDSVRGHAAGALAAIGPAAAEDVVEAARDANPLVRRAAFRAQADMAQRPPAFLAESIKALQDPDAKVREAAAKVAGKFGSGAKSAAPELTALLADPVSGVRSEAADALGYIGAQAQSATPQLIALLSDAEMSVVNSAARALDKIGAPDEAAHPLALALERNSYSAASALKHMGLAALPEVWPELSCSTASVRVAALEILGEVGPAAASGVSEVERLLRDPAAAVRKAAVSALAAVSGARAQAKLIRALHDQDAGIRAVAANALGKIGASGNAAVVSELLLALKDDDAGVRYYAMDALCELRPGKEHMPDIAQAFQDPAANVQKSAALALGDMGGEALPHLLAAAASIKNSTRQAAVGGLGRLLRNASLGNKRALDGLAKTLSDKNAEVRCAAAKELNSSVRNAKPAAAQLLAALEDPNACVRVNALAALEPAGAATPARMIPLLKDRDRDVRQAAARTLGKLGLAARGARSALLAGLSDDDKYVRYDAAQALPATGAAPADILPVLLKMACEDDAYAASGAMYGLRAIGPSARVVLPALEQLLSAKDYERADSFKSVVYGAGQPQYTVPAALDLLADPSPAVRAIALAIAGGSGYASRELFVLYAAALGDPNDKVQYAAAEAIYSSGADFKEEAQTVVPAVIKAMGGAGAALRQKLVGALYKIGPQALMPGRQEILAQFSSRDRWVRVNAASVLANLSGVSDIVPQLLKAYQAGDGYERSYLLKAIARNGAPEQAAP